MGRTVFIDLSAKIEQWTADTVVAMTNGNDTLLILPSQVKQAARNYLKDSNPKPRQVAIYIYQLLAILIYLAIESNADDIEYIVIDNDYPGEDPAGKIKNELVPLLKPILPTIKGTHIKFQQLKDSNADKVARQMFLSEKREGKLVTLEDIKRVWGK